MKKVFWLTLLIVFCYCSLSFANTFLYNMSKHTMTVRSHGMGYAGLANSDDEAATIRNPASLSYPGSSYSFQKLDYDQTSNRIYQAHYYYNRPIGFASVIQEDSSGNKLTMNAFGIGVFGHKSVSWGVNYKSIHGTAEGENIQGWSSDLGIIFRVVPWFNTAINIKDIYSKDLDLNETIEFGMSGLHKKNAFSWSFDLLYENNDEKQVYSRFGTSFFSRLIEFTFGYE